jgi:hypothetical protein
MDHLEVEIDYAGRRRGLLSWLLVGQWRRLTVVSLLVDSCGWRGVVDTLEGCSSRAKKMSICS